MLEYIVSYIIRITNYTRRAASTYSFRLRRHNIRFACGIGPEQDR